MKSTLASKKKLKVMTILGTRPEIIRLSRIIPKLDKFTNHKLVHTGQNYDYELNEIFFDDLELRKPDIFLDCASSNTAKTISSVISKTDDVISDFQPEAILILGDTDSSLASIAAKRQKIPIFHMEAGNRCFDERVPEEINRKIVDHISDINMPYSDIARHYLIKEGLSPDQIIKTGSPLDEVVNYYRKKIDSSNVLEEFKLNEYEYFVVSAHRQENVDDIKNLKNLALILEQLSEKFNIPIIFSTHPRTRKRLEQYNLKFNPLVKLSKPLKFTDYIALQESAKIVLSDSGTITEESSILNFPAINIREAPERPEGMEEGSVIMSGLDPKIVLNSIDLLSSQKRGAKRNLQKVKDYCAPNVSEKVVRIILSYVDYVNRNTWKKF